MKEKQRNLHAGKGYKKNACLYCQDPKPEIKQERADNKHFSWYIMKIQTFSVDASL